MDQRTSVPRPDRVPIGNYVLKVASRCNLNCSYCYMYNKGDESYKIQPYRMSAATVSTLLSRVRTHCLSENLQEVFFSFHGGEPLLAGRDFFRRFVASAGAVLGESIQPNYAVETNGTLLDREWLDLFCELNVAFGISLDGPPALHNRVRVNHAGAGSYREVRRALDAVLADRRCEVLFGGILTVIDLASDPLELYQHFRDIGVSRCDFLLPDGTRDSPPTGITPNAPQTPYADWLIAIFDTWFDSQDTSFSIRLFANIIGLLFDPDGGNDALGGGANGLLVIETDGGIEPVDVLKICGPSFTKTGLNVARNEISDIYCVSLANLYLEGGRAACNTCHACPVFSVCGGGYLPHRYSSANGFDNPSVYCRDLMKLITHIRDRVLLTLPPQTRQRLRMEPLPYARALALLNSSRPAHLG
ncbi:MAG: radical SAM protein [Candidatus Korobacteraceae bacterium]